jgi:hypothetical protein
MPTFRMLLVEELVESDSGEFSVDAQTPQDAAALLIEAHNRARDQCTSWVTLPDGQKRHIEPENVVRTRVFCVLLDDKGEEVAEIDSSSTNQCRGLADAVTVLTS